jgi:hypothetical protein
MNNFLNIHLFPYSIAVVSGKVPAKNRYEPQTTLPILEDTELFDFSPLPRWGRGAG